MSAKHRVKQAFVKLEAEPADSWAYEMTTLDDRVIFSFSKERSAQLMEDFLRHVFKSTRPPLFHNGLKPRGRK